MAEAVDLVDGIPTGSLVTQLLWKSVSPRPEDGIDLDAALTLMSTAQLDWLRESITRAHPYSPWIGLLNDRL
jgi:hypothetical protein